MAAVNGGGTVLLRGGQYVEPVHLKGVSGSSECPIVVRQYRCERPTIDASVLEFRFPSAAWMPAPGGHADEWVSVHPMTPPPGHGSTLNRGAFLRVRRHTRLVSYDRIEDLRSDNELWPKPEELFLDLDMLGDGVAHEIFWKDDDDNFHAFVPHGRARPFVYMGPGIWFDERSVDDGGHRVHIRLSHTHNEVDGWPDYNGLTDPRQVPLALSWDQSHVFKLEDCHDIRFERLRIRYGGEDTMRLRNCQRIVLCRLDLWAGSRAVRMERDNNATPPDATEQIEVRDCRIDGGLPTWYFRSDRKDDYWYRPTPGGPYVHNNVGYATGGNLVSARNSHASDVSVHHCEIRNAHDLSVAHGPRAEFHHNWVHNLNDDSVIIDGHPSAYDVKIYRNVITQCLTALSFAGGTAGQVWIYRNLFDIRRPTLGIRPRSTGEQQSLRQGQFYKDGKFKGPFDLFHNTCVVLDPGQIGAAGHDPAEAGFAHYKQVAGGELRQSFNNLFVVAYSRPERARRIAFLPRGSGPHRTNGNIYHRFGTGTLEKFRIEDAAPDSFADLADYQAPETPSEKDGASEDPHFASYDPVDAQSLADFRLSAASSWAATHAIELPDNLEDMARWPPWLPDWVPFPNHRGAYRWSQDIFFVGVRGLRRFPGTTF